MKIVVFSSFLPLSMLSKSMFYTRNIKAFRNVCLSCIVSASRSTDRCLNTMLKLFSLCRISLHLNLLKLVDTLPLVIFWIFLISNCFLRLLVF